MIRYNDMKVWLGYRLPSFELMEWRNDFAVWKWCRQHTLINMEQQSRWYDWASKDPSVKMFSVIAPTPTVTEGPSRGTVDMVVGVCGLTSIDQRNQKAEFSLYIGPEHRRKGYARDALLTLLKHGFDDWNLNRIWGETFQGNPAAALFRSIGMEQEGMHEAAYFRNGKFINSFTFAILRENFYARHRDRLGDCHERSGHVPEPGDGGAERADPVQPAADGGEAQWISQAEALKRLKSSAGVVFPGALGVRIRES